MKGRDSVIPKNMLAFLLGNEAYQSSPDEVDTWCVTHQDSDKRVLMLEEWGVRLIDLLNRRGIEVKYK